MNRTLRKAVAFGTAVCVGLSTLSLNFAIGGQEENGASSYTELAEQIYSDGVAFDNAAVMLANGTWGKQMDTNTDIVFIGADKEKKEIENKDQNGNKLFDTAFPLISSQGGSYNLVKLVKGEEEAVIKTDGTYFGDTLEFYSSVKPITDKIICVKDSSGNEKYLFQNGKEIEEEDIEVFEFGEKSFIYSSNRARVTIFDKDGNNIDEIQNCCEIRAKSNEYFLYIDDEGNYYLYGEDGNIINKLPYKSEGNYMININTDIIDEGLIVINGVLIDYTVNKVISDKSDYDISMYYVSSGGFSYCEETDDSEYEYFTDWSDNKLNITEALSDMATATGNSEISGSYTYNNGQLLLSSYGKTYIYHNTDGFSSNKTEVNGELATLSKDETIAVYMDPDTNKVLSINNIDGTLIKDLSTESMWLDTGAIDQQVIDNDKNKNLSKYMVAILLDEDNNKIGLLSDGSLTQSYLDIMFYSNELGYYMANKDSENCLLNLAGDIVFQFNDTEFNDTKESVYTSTYYTDKNGYMTVIYKDGSYDIYDRNLNKVFSDEYSLFNTETDIEKYDEEYDDYYYETIDYGQKYNSEDKLLNYCSDTGFRITAKKNSDESLSYGAIKLNELDLSKEVESGFNIAYVTNGGSRVNRESGKSALPDNLPVTYRNGYTFAGWFTDEALSISATPGAALEANTTLFAKWTQGKYNLTVTDGSASGQYNNGETVSITANDKDGYIFTGWTVTSGNATLSSTISKTTSFTMPEADVTIKANYNKVVDINTLSLSYNKTSFTYNGKSQKTGVTVKNGSATLKLNTDYTISYVNSTGTVVTSCVNPGTYKVIVSGIGAYNGKVEKAFTINKASQKITLSKTSYTKTMIDSKFNLGAKVSVGNGKLSYSNSNAKVVTVDSTGNVTIKGVGTAYITVKAAATTGYNQATSKVTIKVTKANQTISAKTSITKTYGDKTFSLGAKRTKGDGKLTYKSSATSVATISSTGKITIKGAGKTTITVTAAGTTKYNSATKKITLTVKPKKNAISSISSPSKGKIKVKWSKDTKVSGYEIQYSTSSKFKSYKTQNVTSKNTITKTFSATKGKKYYVRVRAYVKVGNSKIYGSFSTVKNVTVKK